jgi:nicotinamidase-related amidase
MLKTEDCCLVIVDVQTRLFEKIYQNDIILENILVLIKSAKLLDIPILWCQQYPKGLGDTDPQIAELLTDQKPIDKLCFSCYGHSDFTAQLESLKRKQVILCGIETHVCVYQTAENLLDNDYGVTVVADAVSSRTEQNKKIAIKKMHSRGVDISSAEMLLFELLNTAEHPKFRDIAKLIK